MATLSTISQKERADAFSFAIDMARTAIGEQRGFVSPNARVGTLSNFEWEKIACGAVSGWVAERSRQVGADRILDEEFLLATGEVPEPYELGIAALVLPSLGDLVEKMGLSDQPIGAWSRDEITLFVWTAADLMNEARARNHERPEPAADGPNFLLGG